MNIKDFSSFGSYVIIKPISEEDPANRMMIGEIYIDSNRGYAKGEIVIFYYTDCKTLMEEDGTKLYAINYYNIIAKKMKKLLNKKSKNSSFNGGVGSF